MKMKSKKIGNLWVKTSASSARKYPNVMWFPRSKTDPQEIREVLKLALKVQEENSDGYFNDKLLGEYMAKIGSINVVGMKGAEYIESYQGKSTGDVSYITNARMLMRFFRFLGLVTRINKAQYQLTEIGKVYAKFNGDFPARANGTDEEAMLLYALANFSFYSINDDSSYRDPAFQVRPFISLLNNLAIEPQCIYQLIVTAFAAKRENEEEIQRVKDILQRLRDGKTTLEKEFSNLGLDANNYSCVHNFYDSAKILVYIGTSLGLIDKTSNPSYGRKIAGKARHLKQASVFYKLTKKGEEYLQEQIKNRLIYYSDIYSLAGDDAVLQLCYILAVLNTTIGSKKVDYIHVDFFRKVFGDNWKQFIDRLVSLLQIEIEINDDFISLKSPVTFNFFQSMPPEFFHTEPFNSWYKMFIEEFNSEKSRYIKFTITKPEEQFTGEVVSRFILDEAKKIGYDVPEMTFEESQNYVKYPDRDSVFGGQDRFASRVSPTNSVILVGDKVHVDNELDALDLLVALRHPNDGLRKFINANIENLMKHFLAKSDTWMKDQHYTWIRNCFRQFGTEAIYSGSGGMLSRADVSVVSPFIGGIEAKSPSENRGSINTKAIRQANDAKIQVASKFPEKRNLPRSAIAIGRRITPLAIEEELKYRSEGQPIMLIADWVLYYLTLKTIDIPFGNEDVIKIFTTNAGLFDKSLLLKNLEEITDSKGMDGAVKEKVRMELDSLHEVIAGSTEGAVEE
jgi:hypothetical protein